MHQRKKYKVFSEGFLALKHLHLLFKIRRLIIRFQHRRIFFECKSCNKRGTTVCKNKSITVYF